MFAVLRVQHQDLTHRELTAPNRKLSPPKKPPETIPVPKASLPRKAGSDVDHTKEEQRRGDWCAMNPFASPFEMLKRWSNETIRSMDAFWFTPKPPHVLAFLRIITGVMLLYSHIALATDLFSFIGLDAWVDNETARGFA